MSNSPETPSQEDEKYNISIGKTEGWLLFGLGVIILGLGLLFTMGPLNYFYSALNDPNPEQTGLFRASLTMPLVSVPIIVCISLPLIFAGIFAYFKQSEKGVKKGFIIGGISGAIIAILICVSFAHNSSGQNFVQRELAWAEKRYGVTFDYIGERIAYRARPTQTHVENDGKIVARVKYDGDRIYFWDPVVEKELHVIMNR